MNVKVLGLDPRPVLLSYVPSKRIWILLAQLQVDAALKSSSAPSIHIANRRSAFPKVLPLELPSTACR